MSTQPLPSLPVFRAALFAAIGVPALVGCRGDSKDPNDETDVTDIVPDPGDSGETDTGTTVIPCADATVLTDSHGSPSGYVQCPDGAILRVDTHVWSEDGQCMTDADCDPGTVCIGDEIGGMGGSDSYCVTASCETGEDCDSGECGLSSYDDGCGTTVQLACRTDDDQCRGDVDCTDGGTNQCVVSYWSEEVWVCAGIDCAIGRPLVVDADGPTAITAGLAVGRGSVDPISGLDDGTRGALAAWWAHVAQMEHASVASFARVTLELMSVGAPSDLLHDVQMAADDEIRHAQSAFALASRFAGVDLSPGPLPTAGVLPRQGMATILEGLIREACVGETVGVAEARAGLLGCTDPMTCAALEAIVADEARHATLAWRTLAWMLDRRPDLVHVAEAAFSEGVAQMLSATPPALPHAPEWGMLGDQARASVREEAVMEVVLPCAQAVLSRARARHVAGACVTGAGPRVVAES